MKKNISVGIVGHIDHGKSTFIGRLLYDSGYLKKYEIAALQQENATQELDFAHFLDVYQEERKNEMTMDTTKRFFETKEYKVTIIDAPGHKEFIQNMLSGVSEAQCAIAMVSCADNEGLQEQSKRHLTLLKILGIPLVAVAINKIDLTNYNEEKFKKTVNEVKSFLEEIGYDLENISFVPVSAKNGEHIYNKSKSMAWYTGPTIIEALDSTYKKIVEEENVPLRMSVQQCFSQENTIFSRIEAGEVKVNDKIIFEPSHIEGIVKSMNIAGKDVDTAKVGDVIGLSLETDNIEDIIRGNIGGKVEERPKAGNQIVAQVMLPFNGYIQVGEEFLFRSGSTESEVIVTKVLEKINSEDLTIIKENDLAIHEGEIGIVNLQFRNPIVVEEYKKCRALGRFLLMKENKGFPGIVLKNSNKVTHSPKIACGVSPTMLPHLDEVTNQKRVAMLRVNGAFPLPNWDELRKQKLPIALDIPGNRAAINKIKTTSLSDDELIDVAIKENLDFVSLSYVNDDSWIKEVQKKASNADCKIKVIAKIETAGAIKNAESIISAADMVLIDRGDLGTAIGFEKVPFYQDKIIDLTKRQGKQILIATELALSTIDARRPTYADVMQLREFSKKGVDFIVLAEETTKNKLPVDSIKSINKILDFSELCY